MGLMQRTKGKVYERAIARELRMRWPEVIIRRASQAERADNPDVFVEGGPPVLSRLWLEMQDVRIPKPLAKLEQAEGDIASWVASRMNRPDIPVRLPIVVWHRISERKHNATTRLWVLGELLGWSTHPFASFGAVTMGLDELLDVLQGREIRRRR